MYRVIFMGTPDFAVPALRTLAADERFQIDLVITQPDMPTGRGLELSAPAIKKCALELGLPIAQPEKLRTEEMISTITSLEPDFIVVVAYGKIISQRILDIPRHGTFNIHGSLLPKYRGASPIQAALLHGETETGVSLMLLTAGMDEGPVLRTTHTPITSETTAGSLFTLLSEQGAALLPDTLVAYAEGQITPMDQDHSQATYCTKLTKADGEIHWDTETTRDILHKWQACTPWPGVYSLRDGKMIKFHKMCVSDRTSSLPSGTLFTEDKKLFMSTVDGVLEILEIQMEGKRRMSGQEYGNGVR